MAVSVFVKGLRVLDISSIGIGAVEQSVGGIVIPGAEVVLVKQGIVLFPSIKQMRSCGLGGVGISAVAQHHAIAVVGIAVIDGSVWIRQLPRRTVAITEQIPRIIDGR